MLCQSTSSNPHSKGPNTNIIMSQEQTADDFQSSREEWRMRSAASLPVASTASREELSDDSALRRNAYDVLGIPETSSFAEIKASFRKLAKETHPDVVVAPSGGSSSSDASASRRFVQILAAYEVGADVRLFSLFFVSAMFVRTDDELSK
ncbi:hypothetical protein ACLOJK_035920 [Asimina triloba]